MNQDFPKIQMPGGLPRGGGMLKLRFDWYITLKFEEFEQLSKNRQELKTLKLDFFSDKQDDVLKARFVDLIYSSLLAHNIKKARNCSVLFPLSVRRSPLTS